MTSMEYSSALEPMAFGGVLLSSFPEEPGAGTWAIMVEEGRGMATMRQMVFVSGALKTDNLQRKSMSGIYILILTYGLVRGIFTLNLNIGK